MIKRKLAEVWRMFRHLTGDDAYERYLRHHVQMHAGEAPLPRKEFFRQRQSEKWTGVKRCC